MADPAIFLPATLQPYLSSYTTIATLWSSYGRIHRLHFRSTTTATTTTSSDHPSPPAPTLILKVIQPPHFTPASSESNLRKLLSYRVERYFYRLPPPVSPAPYKLATAYPCNSPDDALLLEDLAPEFPVSAPGYLDLNQTRTVLRWLARFHGTWMGRVDAQEGEGEEGEEGLPEVAPPLEVAEPERAEGVWAQGGYWYLATRSEEYAALQDSGSEYAFLHPWIERVSAKLHSRSEPGRTLVHGDLKSANIFFSPGCGECACYDLQYVGKGVGAVDLVYLLATSVERRVVADEKTVQGLLREYYEEVVETVGGSGGMGRGRGKGFAWEVLAAQVEVAVVDWFRFMAGWGFWGNGVFASEARVRRIIERWEEKGFGALE